MPDPCAKCGRDAERAAAYLVNQAVESAVRDRDEWIARFRAAEARAAALEAALRELAQGADALAVRSRHSLRSLRTGVLAGDSKENQ